MYEFNLLIKNNSGPYLHFVVTDVNLLEMYKSALSSGADTIMWEKGVIPMYAIAGIFDITQPKPSK